VSAAQNNEKLESIFDVAFRLFGTQGFFETKMSDIAEEAGIAKGTLYLYFSSKEQLYTAMTVREFTRYVQQLRLLLQHENSFDERLDIIARHHLSYYFRVKQYTRTFFHAQNNEWFLMEALRTFMENYTTTVAQSLEEMGVEDAGLHAKSFIGILDVFKMDILFDPHFSEHDLEQRIAFAVKLFRFGCKPA
jgi:TetR/AcrR family fatty acid metabolism transcriptional regulator